jgi:hypothetical protein
MDPKIWGPKLWFVIHTIALNYPNNPTYQDKRNHEDFFNQLVYMIPCDKCRIHYRQRLDKYPVIQHLENSDTLFRYTILIHNDVNEMLNKPRLSYEDVLKFYKKSYDKNSVVETVFNKKALIGCLIVIVLIAIGYVIYRKYPTRLIQIKK